MKTLKKYYEDLVLNPEPNMFCMLKPGFAQYKDEFENLLRLNGWKIIAQCVKKFTRPEIEDFYIMHKDKPFYHKLCDYMITDDCICYTCYKRCKNPVEDMDAFKKKIRDEWGEDEMKNGMHSSDSKENVKRESIMAFAVNEKLKVNISNTASVDVEFGKFITFMCSETETPYDKIDPNDLQWGLNNGPISEIYLPKYFSNSWTKLYHFWEEYKDDIVCVTDRKIDDPNEEFPYYICWEVGGISFEDGPFKRSLVEDWNNGKRTKELEYFIV